MPRIQWLPKRGAISKCSTGCRAPKANRSVFENSPCRERGVSDRVPCRSEPPTTIAGGLAIREPIAASLDRVRALVDDVVLVDDDDIRAAMALISDTIGVLVEPSGAAGVAAVQRHALPGERIAIVLTGASERPDWIAALTGHDAG